MIDYFDLPPDLLADVLAMDPQATGVSLAPPLISFDDTPFVTPGQFLTPWERVQFDAALANLRAGADVGGTLNRLIGEAPSVADAVAAAMLVQEGPQQSVVVPEAMLTPDERVAFDTALANLRAGADLTGTLGRLAQDAPRVAEAVAITLGESGAATPAEFDAVAAALGEIDPARLAASLDDERFMIFGNKLTQAINEIGVTDQNVLVNLKTGKPLTQEEQTGLRNTLQKWSEALGLDTQLGKMLGALGLGAVGLGLSQAITSSGDAGKLTLPQSTPVPASVATARDALTRALTQPTTDAYTRALTQPTTAGSTVDAQSLVAALTPAERSAYDTALANLRAGADLPGTLARLDREAPRVANAVGVAMGVRGAAQPGTTATPGLPVNLGPSATAGIDLEQMLRSGTAAQRNIADLILATSGRELLTDAEQAPLERATRLQSLTEIPGLLRPVGETDPVLTGLTDRLNRALRGEVSNPALERAFREEEDTVRNALRLQLGPGYELSTPGMDRLQKLKESQAVRREDDVRQTIAGVAPLELGRRQFGEGLRQQGLTERAGLLNLGRQPATSLASTASLLAPVQPLLNPNLEAQERSVADAVRLQTALSAFQSREADRRALGQSVASLFSGAAGYGLGGNRGLTLQVA